MTGSISVLVYDVLYTWNIVCNVLIQAQRSGREQESQHHVHGDDGRQKEEETEVNVNEYYISLDLA